MKARQGNAVAAAVWKYSRPVDLDDAAARFHVVKWLWDRVDITPVDWDWFIRPIQTVAFDEIELADAPQTPADHPFLVCEGCGAWQWIGQEATQEALDAVPVLVCVCGHRTFSWRRDKPQGGHVEFMFPIEWDGQLRAWPRINAHLRARGYRSCFSTVDVKAGVWAVGAMPH